MASEPSVNENTSGTAIELKDIQTKGKPEDDIQDETANESIESEDVHNVRQKLLSPTVPRSKISLTANESADKTEGPQRKWEQGNTETLKWIQDNIKQRECSRFIPRENQNTNQDQVQCQCGYKFKDHTQEAKTNKNQTDCWDSATHSIEKPTDAFGEIKFVGYGGNVAKYIRVDVNTPTQDMLELMMKVWGMDKPNLVISVAGGTKNYKINKRLELAFRRGLKKIALTPGALIITDGIHSGAMKHVGEAVNDFGMTSKNPKITIGIAPWGCVKKMEVLIDNECKGKWPARYRIEKERRSKERFLHPNHSHFILVDNGTKHKLDVEILFRAKLENEVANIKTKPGENAVSVPIVLLALDGGAGALETVYQSLLNKTPVVIVKGSGMTADILAYAYQNCIERDSDAQDRQGEEQNKSMRFMEDSVEVKVMEMVEKELGKENLSVHISRIKGCLDNYDLMSVFDLDNKATTNELDVAILQALLKANKDQMMDLLSLGIVWNRIDVVKSNIFTDDKHWPRGRLDDVMFSAIQLNRVDFVELFLDHGVNLREFFTDSRLLALYNEIPQNCLLRTLAKTNNKENSSFKLRDVGLLMKKLLGDYYRPHYTDRDNVNSNKSASSAYVGNPINELFIWAVLMIRQDLAKLFWTERKDDAIAAALVANGLLRAMKESTQDKEVTTKIQENMDEWSDLAIGVLSECYSTDEKKAQNLLVRKLTNWGDSTCMRIAMKSDNKDFIIHTACQSLHNSIWMGKMTQENSTFKLLMCMIIPPLILAFVKFQSNEEEAMDNTNTQEIPESHKKSLKRQRTFQRDNSYMSIRADMDKEKERPGEIVCFFKAPIIIFMYDVISYLVFLMLFSYVLIFNFGPKMSSAEIMLMIWVFTIFIEEIRQIATTTSESLGTKLQIYITEMWNVVDIITIGLFSIGMVLRSLPYPNTFEAARVILALNFVSFFLRLLHLFSVHNVLGPKLVMIGRMMQDLMYFVVILMVFVVSYAIASHSVLFPNSPVRWSTIVSLIRRAYWNVYGELFLDEIEDDQECTFDEMVWINDEYPRCPTDVGRMVVPIMMGVYMILANVLLLNLLIAMFSNTFQKKHDNTDKLWYSRRYSLIYEYYTRPLLCPPLILCSHFYLSVKFLWTRYVCKTNEPHERNDYENDYCRQFKNEHKLGEWEKIVADAFRHKTKLKGSDSMEYKVNSTHDSLQMLITRIDEIQEHQTTLSAASPGQPAASGSEVNPLLIPTDVVMKMPPILDLRLHKLETQMEWIVAALQKSQGIQDITMAALPDHEKEELKRKKKKAKAQKQKQKILELFNRSLKYHVRSRQSPYLGSDIHRVTLQDDQISWKENLHNYSPPSYTSPEVYAQPPWADPDIMALPVQERLNTNLSFNTIDKTYNCNRMSFLGKYLLTAGLPLNPKGRTGLLGRGSLGRWGPNHVGYPVVTRWHMKDNCVNIKHGRPVLELLVVKAVMWALPESIAQPDTCPADHIKADFTKEALGHLDGDTNAKIIKKKLETFWKKGLQIYKGYADDPRNTDNAWLETTVYNYHDDDGTILQHFNFMAGDTLERASWIPASSNAHMHRSDLYFLQLVCDKLRANF